MDYLIQTIVDFAKWIWQLVKNVFKALWDVCVDFVCYIVDKVLTFGIELLNAIDVSGVSQVGAWSSLPSEVTNMLGLLGVGQCMAIIASAILIRLALQLIPLTRLGS